MTVHPAKTQISLGICPVGSESLLSAWRNIGPLTTFWAHSENSDQTGQMPRLIWVFAGRICHFVGFVMWWLVYLMSRSMIKLIKWNVQLVKTQRTACSVWPVSLLGAQWTAKDLKHADSYDPDQSARISRLIRVFAGHTGHFVGFVMLRFIYAWRW